MKKNIYFLLLATLAGCGSSGGDTPPRQEARSEAEIKADMQDGYYNLTAISDYPVSDEGYACYSATGEGLVSNGVLIGTMSANKGNVKWPLVGTVEADGTIEGVYGPEGSEEPSGYLAGDLIDGGIYYDVYGCAGNWTIEKDTSR